MLVGYFWDGVPRHLAVSIRVICIALAHLIPWRHHQKMALSSPSDVGNQHWCNVVLTATSPGNRKGIRKGNWSWWKKKRKSWKKPQLWLSWVTRALGSMSALRAYCAHEQAESNSEINCIMIEKIKWKAPTSEFVIEEMEISTFPQQRSWEEMWEGKVFKVIL